MRGGDSRDVSMIIGRRDLHHIRPDNIHRTEPTHDRQRLPRRQSARHRRARAWRECRIEAIDIKRQIRGTLAHDRDNALDRRARAMIMNPCRIQNVHPEEIVIPGADANLH